MSSPSPSFISVAPVKSHRSDKVSFLLNPYIGASNIFTLIFPLTLFIAKAFTTCCSTSAIINKLLLFLIMYSSTPCIFLMFSILDSTINTKGLSSSAVPFSLLFIK